MNTKPEIDDLDATAELPQLDLATAAEVFEEKPGGRAGDTARTDTWRAIGYREAETTSADTWDLADELISVRDTIHALQAELATLQSAHAELGRQHDLLQSDHKKSLVSAEEAAKDQARLAEERLLLLESNQLLRDQAAQYRREAETNLGEKSAEVEQQRQMIATLKGEIKKEKATSKTAETAFQKRFEELSGMLATAGAQSEQLNQSILELQSAKQEQETAAAKLAQSFALLSIESGTLRDAVSHRDRYLKQLQESKHELEGTLSAANRTVAVLQDELDGVRQQYTSTSLRSTDLQKQLETAEQRIVDLTKKVDAQFTYSQALEQERTGLQGVLETERRSSERMGQEAKQQSEQIENLLRQLTAGESANAELNLQNRELKSSLTEGDRKLTELQRELAATAAANAKLEEQQSGLFAELESVTEQFSKTKAALREEQESSERLTTDTEALRRLNTELAAVNDQRDKFILEQSRELEQLQSSSQLALERTKGLEESNQVQTQRIVDLETQLVEVRAGYSAQAEALQKLRHELSAKNAERIAAAKQVMELQQQLRQQTEALNSIRSDIRKVAHPEHREAETLLRTLVRVDDGSVVHLLNKNVMSIGRSSDNDIQIHSDAISRHHANLRISREAVIMEDLGSTNGCYVNGRRVRRCLLKDGDKFELGNMAFKFALRPSSSSVS